MDALVLLAQRAVRRERKVVRRDPQPEPATPVRKRALHARVRAPDRVFVNIPNALQVVHDGVPGVAELKLGCAGAVGVDEIAQVQAALCRGALDGLKQLAVGLDRGPRLMGCRGRGRHARPSARLRSVIRKAHRSQGCQRGRTPGGFFLAASAGTVRPPHGG